MLTFLGRPSSISLYTAEQTQMLERNICIKNKQFASSDVKTRLSSQLGTVFSKLVFFPVIEML